MKNSWTKGNSALKVLSLQRLCSPMFHYDRCHLLDWPWLLPSWFTEMSTITATTPADLISVPEDLSKDPGSRVRRRAHAMPLCSHQCRFLSRWPRQEWSKPYPTSMVESIQTPRVPKSLLTSSNLYFVLSRTGFYNLCHLCHQKSTLAEIIFHTVHHCNLFIWLERKG